MASERRSGSLTRIRQMIAAPHRLERTAGLLEIRANQLCDRETFPSNGVQDWSNYVAALTDGLYGEGDWPSAVVEAERVVTTVAERACAVSARGETFPQHFNADTSLATIAYCLARVLRPSTVVETGVAYGFMTAVLVEALAANGMGSLHSIDLPSLDDPDGHTTGILVPASCDNRWTLHRGSSRRLLPHMVATAGLMDMFVHDSANVSSMQRFEVGVVWPRLAPGGIVVINNARPSIVRRLSRLTSQVSVVRQVDKPDCVTAVAQKQSGWTAA